jgi:hypothetical protein
MIRRILFSSALVMAAAQPAIAADFTLDVPVRLVNTPGIETLYVECLISRVEAGGVSAAGGSNVVARGRQSVPISGGSYEGTVTVEMDNSSIVPSSEARSYICSMRGVGTARTGTAFTASSGNFADVYLTAMGITLDSVRTTVQGNLR